eukprot:364502-Chlamydomonas_euryale.AAC.22
MGCAWQPPMRPPCSLPCNCAPRRKLVPSAAPHAPPLSPRVCCLSECCAHAGGARTRCFAMAFSRISTHAPLPPPLGCANTGTFVPSACSREDSDWVGFEGGSEEC